ncbi:expressed unknown protein [Seminavis robusta]|uniref:Uncharacterized protein n=1 Tax=Seminavis robusta TaxID=568900 RepID=A0A9N8HT44_9STRA|nr:expressed unknown protein [Seminavis robusta]|eukprot:Sro1531_g280140.1 n/a (384) ;mRNA; f:4941-6092
MPPFEQDQDATTVLDNSVKMSLSSVEEGATSGSTANQGEGGEEEYRRRCRHFYRQSTSVDDDFTSLDADDQDDDAYVDEEEATRQHSSKKTDEENRLVLEAVDQMSDATSYSAFLANLTPEQLVVLCSCGLPTSITTSSSTYDATREKWVQIRTEERQLAHQVNMRERLHKLESILQEFLLQQQPQQQPQQQQQQPQDDNDSFLTTRQQVIMIKQTLRLFVHNYHADCIASHSLMAGMRHILELQLDKNEDAPCIVWTFDANVISEAIVAQTQGASSAYIKEALHALLVFLVYQEPQKDPEHNNNNTHQRMLQFAVEPSLSDKTLTQILQVLPRPHELHARPTGKYNTPAQGLVRTNVDGELDEPMDVCSLIVKNLRKRGWWF